MINASRSTPMRTLPISELAWAGREDMKWPIGVAVTLTSLSTTWDSDLMMCLSDHEAAQVARREVQLHFTDLLCLEE